MKTRITVLLGLSLVLAAMYVYGQTTAVKAKIDFPFTVEGKVLPAGQYEFTRNEDGSSFQIQGEGPHMALAMTLTRLDGETRGKKPETCVVFDKVGDTHSLSEIWFPGEDGYLMAFIKVKHTHKTVHMK